MSGNARRAGMTVTSKVLLILGAFSQRNPELTLTEICRIADLAVPTAYRLASELLEWGALERTPSGAYRVGLRLWEVGSLAPQAFTLRQVAQPYMQDLYAATRENVQLAVRDGHHALYVEKVFGRRAVPVVSHVGHRLPLHSTGVGKILLAFSPPDFQEQTIRRGLGRYTAHTIVMPGSLARALERTRQTDIAVCAEEMSLGTVSVAAPVRDPNGTTIAALSLVVRSSSADVRRVTTAVRTAALGITREIGRRPLAASERTRG
jgi:DNA-binding IclR family transcriptional regulator